MIFNIVFCFFAFILKYIFIYLLIYYRFQKKYIGVLRCIGFQTFWHIIVYQFVLTQIVYLLILWILIFLLKIFFFISKDLLNLCKAINEYDAVLNMLKNRFSDYLTLSKSFMKEVWLLLYISVIYWCMFLTVL